MAKYTLHKPRKRKPPKLTEREKQLLQYERDWPSLSEGMTIPEKLVLAKKLRGEGRMPKLIANRLRPPTTEEMRALALHCSRAIVKRNGGGHRSDRIFVLVRLVFNYRFYEKSLPIGDIAEVELFHNVFRFNANLLLDWLHDKGYIDYNSRALRKHLGAVEKSLSDWRKSFPIIDAYAPDYVITSAWENIIKELDEEGEK